MIVSGVKDKDLWEDFLSGCEEKTFLQSWNWGEFNKMMGNKIWREGIYNNNQLMATALIIKNITKRGTFFLIPHGPNIKNKNDNLKLKIEILQILLNSIKEIAKNEKVSFIRISPLWQKNEENIQLFKELGFRESPIHANAYEATWKLDITASEEELLTNMRKTTRYLIRQTLKNGDISIEKSSNLKDIELYQKLNEEVAKRQKFVPFSFEFLKKEFETFLKDSQALLFFGKYKGETVAAALSIFWSKTGFYHQAASSQKYAKFSIPYLLQWEAIKEAKKKGCTCYDFWGYVNPKENPQHPWAGPTLFKMGFGGKAYEYVKTQDFPFSKRYWLTNIFEKLRKTKRRL